MTKQNSNEFTYKRTKIITILGFIPILRIIYKVSSINIENKQITRLTNLYWLFGFIPLFSTEKDYLPDNTKPEYKYYDDMPLI